jgi:DDE superfamily endonuclease
MTRKVPLSLGLILIAAPDLANAQMAHYEPKTWCDEVARSSGSLSRVIMNRCLRQEYQSYDQLAPRWSSLPADMQSSCNQVALSSGNGSYMILLGCVQGVVQSWVTGEGASEPVVLVEDNRPIHVSKLSRAALAAHAHWLTVEWLPKYTPELNDIEVVSSGTT